MHERWPHDVIARLVASAVQTTRASAVVTFDTVGVSGHANHIATHQGVLAWAQASQRSGHCWLLVRA